MLNSDLNLRFLTLNKLQAVTLIREIPGATYKQHDKNNGYIGQVPLTEENLDALNIFYVRQQVQVTDCEVLMTLRSSNDNATLVAPAIVNKLLKHIDCQLRFSFTILRV